MTSDELLSSLLGFVLSGRGLSIQPSLANLNISEVSILRVDNLVINLASAASGRNRDAKGPARPFRLALRDKK